MQPPLCFYNWPADTYYVKVQAREGSWQDVIGSYSVSLSVESVSSQTGLTDQYEPDDTRAEATVLQDSDLTVFDEHSIYPAGDVDWMKFTTTTAGNACVKVSEPAGRQPVKLTASVETSAGAPVVSGNISGTNIPPLCFYNRPADMYYVRVEKEKLSGQAVIGSY